jgi:hypothetical protein
MRQGISIDRMPMLNVIFDRMAATCTDSLQPMAGTPCFFSVSGISNGRVGDIIKEYEANAVAAVFYAEQWDTRILIMLDGDFVFTMVEALFGSDGAEPPIDVERSFSNIELRLVQVLFERFAKALQSAFAAISEVTFRLERVETAMASLAIGRSGNMSICANIMLQGAFPWRADVPHHTSFRAQSTAAEARPCRRQRRPGGRSELARANGERGPTNRGDAECGPRTAHAPARRRRQIPCRAGP